VKGVLALYTVKGVLALYTVKGVLALYTVKGVLALYTVKGVLALYTVKDVLALWRDWNGDWAANHCRKVVLRYKLINMYGKGLTTRKPSHHKPHSWLIIP